MIMFPMLTEETPTYICLSGLDCDEAERGIMTSVIHITAHVIFRRELLRTIGHLQAMELIDFLYESAVSINNVASYNIAPRNVKPDLFAGCSKRLRGKHFSLFVFVARVRKRARLRITSTIDCETIERNEGHEGFLAGCTI